MSGLDFYSNNVAKLENIKKTILNSNCPINKSSILKHKSGLVFLYSLTDKLFKEAAFYRKKFELLEKEHNELLERLEKTEEKTFITATKVEVK